MSAIGFCIYAILRKFRMRHELCGENSSALQLTSERHMYEASEKYNLRTTNVVSDTRQKRQISEATNTGAILP